MRTGPFWNSDGFPNSGSTLRFMQLFLFSLSCWSLKPASPAWFSVRNVNILKEPRDNDTEKCSTWSLILEFIDEDVTYEYAELLLYRVYLLMFAVIPITTEQSSSNLGYLKSHDILWITKSMFLKNGKPAIIQWAKAKFSNDCPSEK